MMKCKNCNSEMMLDDKDVNKNKTEYVYICENCDTCCIKTEKDKIVVDVTWCEE